jgi:hypothetical protein
VKGIKKNDINIASEKITRFMNAMIMNISIGLCRSIFSSINIKKIPDIIIVTI